MYSDDSKNFVIITTSPFPFGCASANLLRHLALGIKKNNNNVEVLLQRGNDFGNEEQFKSRSNYFESIKFSYASFKKRSKYIVLRILDTLFGSIIPTFFILNINVQKKIDYIIIYNEHIYEVLPSIMLSKLLGIKIVRYLVDWMPKEDIQSRLWQFPKWWFYLLYLKKVNLYFNGLIVISNFFKSFYIEKKFPESRIFVLPNLLNLDRFDFVNSSTKKKKVKIGYCGTPSKRDGIKYLLEAFSIICKKNENVKLLIIGDVANKTIIPDLLKIAHQLKIVRKVRFLGRVDNKTIPKLLNSCDVLVLPRPGGRMTEAGFPTKLGEYFASRKPVVATEVGDLKHYLDDMQNVVFSKPSDSIDLADKLDLTIKDDNLSNRIAENGFIWAKENLEYIAKTKDLICFLERL